MTKVAYLIAGTWCVGAGGFLAEGVRALQVSPQGRTDAGTEPWSLLLSRCHRWQMINCLVDETNFAFALGSKNICGYFYESNDQDS